MDDGDPAAAARRSTPAEGMNEVDTGGAATASLREEGDDIGAALPLPVLGTVTHAPLP